MSVRTFVQPSYLGISRGCITKQEITTQFDYFDVDAKVCCIRIYRMRRGVTRDLRRRHFRGVLRAAAKDLLDGKTLATPTGTLDVGIVEDKLG